jgi:plasmid stability protein
MGKALQIRNVPDQVLDELKAQARRKGVSLSAYALGVLSREADRPALREALALPPVGGGRIGAEEVLSALRRERGSR